MRCGSCSLGAKCSRRCCQGLMHWRSSSVRLLSSLFPAYSKSGSVLWSCIVCFCGWARITWAPCGCCPGSAPSVAVLWSMHGGCLSLWSLHLPMAWLIPAQDHTVLAVLGACSVLLPWLFWAGDQSCCSWLCPRLDPRTWLHFFLTWEVWSNY